MIDFPPKYVIAQTLRPGAVFYFPEPTHDGDDSHFFVVLNRNPETDTKIVLAHATSQIEKTRKFAAPHDGTLIELTPEQYSEFTKPISAFNCNNITKKTVAELEALVAARKLFPKKPMPDDIVDALRQAVCNSPLIEGRWKKLVK